MVLRHIHLYNSKRKHKTECLIKKSPRKTDKTTQSMNDCVCSYDKKIKQLLCLGAENIGTILCKSLVGKKYLIL